MRVLICGDRNWTDIETIADCIRVLPLHSTVIHGAARGADSIAGALAGTAPTLDVESYPAKWDRYGRAAGPIRNQQMLDEGKPDLVLYFHDNLAQSKGTADMVRRAQKAGIPVRQGQ